MNRKKDLLANIRNGKELNFSDRIQLIIQLSIPAILAQVTSFIMQYIDASMVGQMGANSSASIGLVASTTWLFGCLGSAVAAGFYIQVAQYIGAKEFSKAKDVLKQSFAVIFALTIFIATIGILISSKLPHLLGGAKEIAKEASLYFLIYSCGIPAHAFNSLSSGMLQASGNVKVPSILNSLMCILDVILNFIFIFKAHVFLFGNYRLTIPGFHLGVAGAALGTILSEYIIVLFMLYYLCIKSPLLAIIGQKTKQTDSHSKTENSLSYTKKAFKLSFPIAIENIIVCSAYVAATKIVAPLGVIAIAANSFAVTAESLCYMPGYGISSASTGIIGQSIGAKRPELAISLGKMTILLGMTLMAISGALMYIFAPFIIGLLTPDKAVQALGAKILRIEAFAEPLYGASIIVTGVLRGAGDTVGPSIMSLVSMWCVRIPLSYFLSIRYGLVGVWIAMCAELCFRGIIFLIRFSRKKWLNKDLSA